MNDTCPISDSGFHRYFISGKTYTDFVPAPEYYQETGSLTAPVLYVRHEYAVLSCNCSKVIRVAVQDK